VLDDPAPQKAVGIHASMPHIQDPGKPKKKKKFNNLNPTSFTCLLVSGNHLTPQSRGGFFPIDSVATDVYFA
jgi:hypothetical protein